MREVRRPDGSHRLLLHVPGLRDEHRLLITALHRAVKGPAHAGPSSFLLRGENEAVLGCEPWARRRIDLQVVSGCNSCQRREVGRAGLPEDLA
jgi:hypothetical protein